MHIRITSKEIDEIGRTPIVQQTAFWSEVKRKQGIGSKAIDIHVDPSDIYTHQGEDQEIVDDMLILFQDMGDGHCMGYVPYGPALTPSEENRGIFLEELSESLRPVLRPDCIVLRYDLMWRSPWSDAGERYQQGRSWNGPPDRNFQELRMNIGTEHWNLRKPNTNNLPSDTIIIDLDRDEDSLLAAMKPKTRYNIRLSSRKGVTVRKAGMDELDIWYSLYTDTCRRNNIFLHDITYFRTVLETDLVKVSSFVDVDLLIAEKDDIPLAAMFLVNSGRRSTYLYGASSSNLRNLMATYALQWAAITRAKERACLEYDMFGISPTSNPSHPLYGLYRFKSGFGGRIIHRMGCWDYPLKSRDYEVFRSLEMKGQGYHTN